MKKFIETYFNLEFIRLNWIMLLLGIIVLVPLLFLVLFVVINGLVHHTFASFVIAWWVAMVVFIIRMNEYGLKYPSKK